MSQNVPIELKNIKFRETEYPMTISIVPAYSEGDYCWGVVVYRDDSLLEQASGDIQPAMDTMEEHGCSEKLLSRVTGLVTYLEEYASPKYSSREDMREMSLHEGWMMMHRAREMAEEDNSLYHRDSDAGQRLLDEVTEE